MILHTADKEFLESIGVVPFDPDDVRIDRNERVRTVVVVAVALLQLAGIVVAMIWTYLPSR